MDNNNIVAAPMAQDVETLYGAWLADHVGSRLDFYEFMTSPSDEREIFLSRCAFDVDFVGSVACPVITFVAC